MAVRVRDINRLKNNTIINIVEMIFKNNKDYAFRTLEIVNIIKEKLKNVKENTIRHSVLVLYRKGYLKRKKISQNESYYWWVGKK